MWKKCLSGKVIQNLCIKYDGLWNSEILYRNEKERKNEIMKHVQNNQYFNTTPSWRKIDIVPLFYECKSTFEAQNSCLLCAKMWTINSQSAKFLKIHLEMEWVDLWQLL